MSSFEVERSTLVQAPVERVYAAVRDFKTWPLWSPWLCGEPNCALEFAEDGQQYSWRGDVVGAGEIKVIKECKNEFIVYELTLHKPWKSTSTVTFKFGAEGDRTRTNWEMKGKLPLHLFWMKNFLVAAIGFDYRRGLAMLKDHIQKGQVPSTLEFLGSGQFEGLSFVGIKTRCRIVDVGEKMEADILRLQKWVQDQHITPSGKPLSIYNKWSLLKGETVYTLCFPVEKIPGWLPEDFESGKIPACQVQRIQHTGSYTHLGNAWSAGMAHLRAKKWKGSRGIKPFEIYETDPTQLPADEMVTMVHFPTASNS